MLTNDFRSFHRRIKLYRILSASIISIDCLSNLVIHLLDYFTLSSIEDKTEIWRLLYLISETIFFTTFIIYTHVQICQGSKTKLTFISFIYLVCGLLLFCFLLIRQLKSFDENSPSHLARVVVYYKWHMDWIIIILNVTSCVLRILGFLFIFLLAGKLKEIDETLENGLSEKAQSILDEQSMKRDFTINKNESMEKDNSFGRERISNSMKATSNLNKEYENDFEGSYKFSSDLYYKRILKDDK